MTNDIADCYATVKAYRYAVAANVIAMSEASERLKQARENAGYASAAAAARAFGFHPQNARDHEAGRRGIGPEHAASYARAYRTTPEWILFGKGSAPRGSSSEPNTPSPARMVPVVGVVRAGAWIEVVEDFQPEEWLPFADPQYDRTEIYALTVEGRSMDKDYPDGSRIFVVPAAHAGVREGDHVVVRRRRSTGVETTLKEVVVEAGGEIALWPRSNDPQHQTPYRLGLARDADDGPEIIGVVVGKYEKRAPRTGRLVL